MISEWTNIDNTPSVDHVKREREIVWEREWGGKQATWYVNEQNGEEREQE